MGKLGRSQDAYDRFSAAVDLPFTVLAVFWLPVFLVPLVFRVPAGIAASLETVDYVFWGLFVAEYLAKLYC